MNFDMFSGCGYWFITKLSGQGGSKTRVGTACTWGGDLPVNALSASALVRPWTGDRLKTFYVLSPDHYPIRCSALQINIQLGILQGLCKLVKIYISWFNILTHWGVPTVDFVTPIWTIWPSITNPIYRNTLCASKAWKFSETAFPSRQTWLNWWRWLNS